VAAVVLQEMAAGPPPAPGGAAAESSPSVVTTLRYRVDGQGALGTRTHHLWIVDADTGSATPLTEGTTDNAAPAWSPTGDRLAFVSNRGDDRLMEFRSALYVTAPGEDARRITPADGVALAPAWSPDGTLLAYTGLPAGTPYGTNHRLLVVPASGSDAPRILTDPATFAGHAGGSLFSDAVLGSKAATRLVWTPDGRAVHVLAAVRARVPLLTVSLDGAITTLAGGDQACVTFSLSRDGQTLAYAAATPLQPADLFVVTRAGDGSWQEPRALTTLNAWLDAYALQRPLALRVTSSDGRAVDAWLLPPPGVVQPTPCPTVLSVHGGPHSSFGYTFFFDMHLLASHGYAVLFVNPRATRGYDDAFALCAIGAWGEGDTPDQLAALDAATALGWVDPARVGVMGLSYGGYMTNWLIGHTDRFRAAVSENSISNLLSEYGTSDIGWYFLPSELGAEPHEDPERYLRLSPLTAAARIHTPLLLLTCLEDWRCPSEQSEQLYTTLKRLGRVVEMVRFPGESHSMLSGGRPVSRVTRRRHLLRWFARYLGGETATPGQASPNPGYDEVSV
jgi:dipeptidyl aminopeptidase/acylaminoacyl peptidase